MASPSPFDCDRRATVTGLVLAGGMARRMGGGDKGLVPLAGRPMVEHVVDALRPQVGTILLSASRNHERYAALGYPVIADALGGYQGPLAGVATALRYCTSEFLVTVPCDAPLLPADLVQRLLAACEASNADVAVASDGERQQPVFLLARARVAPALEAYLAGGGRRVDAWLGRVRAAVADFGDEPHAFVNVNDPDERERVEALLLATAGVDSCDRPGHGHLPLQFEEARARMIAAIAPVVGQEVVGLRDALGRVLARDLHSPLDVPSHRNSAMDGYALAGSDLPPQGYASLEVVGTSWAGRAYAGAVAPGQCVRIMTGAMLPDATDTVVMQEQVRLENGRVVIEGGHRPGENVRPVGEDIRRGDLALAAGAVLRPAQLGVLASLGVDQVSVRRRPRVAIFSTGDELVAIGEVLAPGQIYDSNRYTLHGMLTRLPFEVIDLGVVKDTREDTLQAFETAAARADAVITSGGVSVGDADYVTETLERHGQVGFWKVAMKPGKPIAFGRFRQAFFFGLPGNPVSAMVTFYQLVRPALLALAGAVDADPPIIVRAACATRLRKHPGRLEFQRGVLERLASGAYTVRSTGHQGAGVLRSMSEANCFIILPLEQGDVEPGTEVEVQPFAGLV